MSTPALPVFIGPYRVLQRLGSGGMGDVYLGEHDGVRAAVKCISRSLADDPEFRIRFRREVALSARVSGVSCARYLGADTEADVPWLATEYVPGLELQKYIAKHGPLPEPAAITFAAALAEALDRIHAAGIIHRDLKPSNVILGSQGPKVIDFGIARAAETTAVTKTGASLGSPGWMAPEQIRGQSVSEASDVFAWGALVAYASTGVAPFGSGSPETLMYRVLETEVDLTQVPDSLRSLCQRALSKEEGVRPSAGECVRELLPSTQVIDAEDAVTRRIDATWIQVPADGPVPITGRRHRRRRSVLVPALFISVTAIIIGATWLAVNRTGTSSEATATTTPVSTTAPVTTPPSTTAQSTTTPFNYSIPQTVPTPTGATMVNMPTTLTGYERNPANDGSAIVRVFSNESHSRIDSFTTGMSGCNRGAWTFTWRSLNPDVTIIAYPSFYLDTGPSTTVPSSLPAASTSGYLGTSLCEGASFVFGAASNGSLTTIVDVAVKWQSWTASPS